jgi:molybdopterin-biosynthesis enzyme MoeA-like protein
MKTFGAVVIGDEILSGKRQDKHFARLAELLGARGLRLSWVEYLGDDRARLTATFRRTLAAGDVVFSFGGIGNTPDDHTRQAAAAALGVGLEIHPEGVVAARQRFGDDMTPQRLQLVNFPAGAQIIPNPFNCVPGFMAREHYFVPGFPQMAHPMIEWVLETFYRDEFCAAPVEKAFLLTGERAYESALLDLMERIVADYPTLRLFSLPSLVGKERRHLELGVEGDPALVERAMAEIRTEIERRGIHWVWRDAPG